MEIYIDVQSLNDVIHAAFACFGVLCGLAIGQAFSFWKW
jgi:hypothetical protein